MRSFNRLLFALASLLTALASTPSLATISRVTGWFHDTGGALTVSVTAGDALVVWIFVAGSTTATISATDNASGGSSTYTLVSAATISGGSDKVACLYVQNAKTATSITPATTAGSVQAMWVDEYSGVALTSAIDGAGHAAYGTFTAGTDNISSGTWTTSNNGDVIAGAFVQTSGGVPSAGSAFTIANNDLTNDNLTEYLIQSSASASTAALFTSPTGGVTGFASGIALSAAGGGGPSCLTTRTTLGVGC